jgi:peptidoglycan/LPS O-acetylase OafA/YrhL
VGNNKTDNRFYILDPLRFIAAYAVLLYHYSIYLKNQDFLVDAFKYGYLGVNFFFLLSGFVIMISAQNRGAFQFAYSRVLRIYPTFIICLLFTISITYLVSDVNFSLAEVFFNASILNDYLDIPNIDGVYWTLQAELKFYGCVFLLLLSGIFCQWKWWVGAWLGLAILYHFFKQPFFLGWFINPEYSFHFIGGVCAYQIYSDRKSVVARVFFVIALVFSGLKSVQQTEDFLKVVTSTEITVALLCNIIFFIFFYLLACGYLKSQKREYFIVLGMISYPLYLIHNKAGKQIFEMLYKYGISEINALIITSIVVLCICWIINYLLEIILTLRPFGIIFSNK